MLVPLPRTKTGVSSFWQVWIAFLGVVVSLFHLGWWWCVSHKPLHYQSSLIHESFDNIPTFGRTAQKGSLLFLVCSSKEWFEFTILFTEAHSKPRIWGFECARLFHQVDVGLTYATPSPPPVKIREIKIPRMRHVCYTHPDLVGSDPLEFVRIGKWIQSCFGLSWTDHHLDLLSSLHFLHLCDVGAVHRQIFDGRVVIVLWDNHIGSEISMWASVVLCDTRLPQASFQAFQTTISFPDSKVKIWAW